MTALTRRGFLAASALGLSGCAARRVPQPAIAAPPAGPRLTRVLVSPDRVIRTTVGLRPFRPTGFVVRAQKLDAKTVIHNYGHGGAGITLSWGTAQLAAEEARGTEARECAVIGCGVVGLATARVLQERGFTATIYTREMPPATTSNLAGGLWEPVSLFEQSRVTPVFRRQFADASRTAFRRYQMLAGEQYAVRWRAVYTLSKHAYAPPGAESPLSDVEALYPEARQLPAGQHPFDVPFAHRRYSMIIEPSLYLAAVMRDFQLAGGRIVVREFASPRDLMGLKEDLLFNCTGLGARDLFGDEELVPIRGQLVCLLPQPEVDYCTLGPGDTYMFPREDGIVLGGSFDRGVSNLEPDPAISERILRDNGSLFSRMKG